ncbi:MAG: hypothetical protein Ct9H300mP29_0370 [Candidatus Neomarinimicrobiota bacterium]|nr:MAG: hypothetical protein Ct9H300mP29_0370 [Candidatus Neomarinimicrobiota bacterium]
MRRPQERTESEPKQEQTPEIDVKKPSKFAESEVLKKFHGWMRKVTPINISYTENVNKTGMGILGEVPLGYRFGWIREHGLEHTKQVGSNTGDWDHKRDFSFAIWIKPYRSLSMNFNYAQNVPKQPPRLWDGKTLHVSRLSFIWETFGESGFPLSLGLVGFG